MVSTSSLSLPSSPLAGEGKNTPISVKKGKGNFVPLSNHSSAPKEGGERKQSFPSINSEKFLALESLKKGGNTPRGTLSSRCVDLLSPRRREEKSSLSKVSYSKHFSPRLFLTQSGSELHACKDLATHYRNLLGEWANELEIVSDECSRRNFDAAFCSEILPQGRSKGKGRRLVKIEAEIRDFVREKLYSKLTGKRAVDFSLCEEGDIICRSPRAQLLSEIMNKIQEATFLVESIVYNIQTSIPKIENFFTKRKEMTKFSVFSYFYLREIVTAQVSVKRLIENINAIALEDVREFLLSLFWGEEGKEVYHLFLQQFAIRPSELVESEYRNVYLLVSSLREILDDSHEVDMTISERESNNNQSRRFLEVLCSDKGLFLKSLKVNNKEVDISDLVSSNVARKRRFIQDFYSLLVDELELVWDKGKIQEEIEATLEGRELFFDRLLYLLVDPWPAFSERLSTLYIGSKSTITVALQGDPSELSIALKSGDCENYEVTRKVCCHLFDQKKGDAGTLFLDWKVRNSSSENGTRGWKGEIKVAEFPILSGRFNFPLMERVVETLKGSLEIFELPIHFERLKSIDRKEAVSFDDDLFRYFMSEKHFTSLEEGSPLQLQWMVKNFCREMVGGIGDSSEEPPLSTDMDRVIEFSRNKGLPYKGEGETFVESELVDKIWCHLNCSNSLLAIFLKRLSHFHQLLLIYHVGKCAKSQWSALLEKRVRELITSNKYIDSPQQVAPHLPSFYRILCDMRDSKHRREKKIYALVTSVICGHWGKKQKKTIESFMSTLRDIVTSDSVVASLVDQVYAERSCVKNLKELNDDYFYIDPTLLKSFTWRETDELSMKISSIDLEQIVRCLCKDGKPVLNRIFINDMNEPLDFGNEEMVGKEGVKHYFKVLLAGLNLYSKCRKSEAEIVRLVEAIANYEGNSEEEKVFLKKNDFTIDLLRQMTIGCWQRGDVVFKHLYKGVINPPLYSKAIFIDHVHINIGDEQNASVKQVKKYGVYERVKYDNAEDLRVKVEPLSELFCSWKTSSFLEEEEVEKKREGLLHSGIFKVESLVIRKDALPEIIATVAVTFTNPDYSLKKQTGWEEEHFFGEIVYPFERVSV